MTKVCRATALITGNSAKLFRKVVRQAWKRDGFGVVVAGAAVSIYGHRAWTPQNSPAPPGEGGHLGDGGDPQVVQARVRPAARAGPGRGSGDRAGARYVAEFVEMVAELLHHHHVGEDEMLWPKLLTEEENKVLPLVSVHITQAEWDALGRNGASS